jgi:hypothetical protein
MKRAKWWVVGSVCGVVAALVVLWLPDRPFSFLGGAPLDSIWIREDFGPDTAVRTYMIMEPLDQVVESARQELEPKGWRRYDYEGDVIFSPHTDIDRQLVESVSIADRDEGASVRVDVASPATWRDRVGVWLRPKSRLKGTPPQ